MSFRRFSIGLIWVWLAVFALVPDILMFITSILQPSDKELIRLVLTTNNYAQLFNTIYLKIFWHSFLMAGVASLICLIIGYPFAYILARSQSKHKSLLLLLVIIPFWTSSLIRAYAIMGLLKAKGILNTLLIHFDLIHRPLQLLYTNSAVMIGLVYTLLPFMILPLYANIEKLDSRLVDAARDLGASRLRIIRQIILPLTWPGILAGFMLVFLPAMSMFYIPDILGGAKSMLLGNLIENLFLEARDWPMGATVSIALTLLMVLLLLIYSRTAKNSKAMGMGQFL